MLFYKELNCTPIRRNEDDCCPYRYECPEREINKCYIHGKEHNIYEKMDIKDSGPCQICRCLYVKG